MKMACFSLPVSLPGSLLQRIPKFNITTEENPARTFTRLQMVRSKSYLQRVILSFLQASNHIENFRSRNVIGAAVFKKPGSCEWAYVSNSESSSEGGVGAIYFDCLGRVTEYKRLLTGTRRNCGGGKTFWGTWMTCEEYSNGQVWEVSDTDFSFLRVLPIEIALTSDLCIH